MQIRESPIKGAEAIITKNALFIFLESVNNKPTSKAPKSTAYITHKYF